MTRIYGFIYEAERRSVNKLVFFPDGLMQCGIMKLKLQYGISKQNSLENTREKYETVLEIHEKNMARSKFRRIGVDFYHGMTSAEFQIASNIPSLPDK